MSVDLKALDNFTLTQHFNVNFACDYSEDNRIFAITDVGVYVISLKGDLTFNFPRLSCKKSFIAPTNYAACENIDIDVNCFNNYLERRDLYEIAITNEYSTNLKHAKPLNIIPVKAEWSPQGLANSTSCVLGVLTNVYNLELYACYVNKTETVEYIMVLNVLQEVIKEERINWQSTARFAIETKLKEFKQRVNTVSIAGFTWGHLFNIGEVWHCALFLGHINGEISIWKIPKQSVSLESWKLHFLGRYKTQLNRIVTMCWHQTTEFGGGLCFADDDGKMSLVHITKLNEDCVQVDSEISFWSENDKVVIEKIAVMEHERCTYILAVKQRTILIFGLDQFGDVFGQKACNFEDIYISGLHIHKNNIYVLTLPGIFNYMTLKEKNNEIEVKMKKISLKMDMKIHRTHGFFFSKNMTIFGLLTQPWSLQSYQHATASYASVFIYHNTNVKPFDLLWNNDTGSLKDYWDCMEALRMICLKEKRFPWLGIPPDLNYDTLSLYHLKLLRHLARLSEMVFNFVPVIKNYDLKPYIVLHYLVEIRLVVQRLKQLLQKMKLKEKLTLFQMRSMDIQNFFLKEMIAKNILAKANVGQKFTEDIKSVMEVANEVRYPDMVQCTWCGEKIIGSTCQPPHIDSRCCFSMMPIYLVPSFKCRICAALAHREILKEQEPIFCPYCDVPMDFIPVSAEMCEDGSERLNVYSDGEVRSPCSSDCLKEGLAFEDIEENTWDYVTFSDSEDEDDSSHLRTLYDRLAKLTLEEMLNWDSSENRDGDSKRVKLEEVGNN